MKNIKFTKVLGKNFTDTLKKLNFSCKYAIITDSNVKKLYGNKLKKQLITSGINAEIFSFSNGEKNKTLKTAEQIIEQLFKKKFHRDDCIVALGGGVVGDLAGFIASIYMRGMRCIQIPTTLLAMVDSSIGGKTGVDNFYGKNLIGTFYQPKNIYIDVDFLKTLPEKEISNGIAEIIKYGVIRKAGIFKMLTNYAKYNKIKDKNLTRKSEKTLLKIIKTCIKIKNSISRKDQKEKNIRKILNYGHTFGHIIEKLSKYKIPHGEAVSIGMVLINKIAENKKLLSKKQAEKIFMVIKTFKLPVVLPKHIKTQDILDLLQFDKKIRKEKNVFVLPKRTGKVILTTGITKNDILNACGK
ncbi:3-dehydroquinate synthase [Candidatus Peregrinibacteria bacterium]|nr:3-dehydroquinate synthase [Candidatus Peregrinibacteria bacterium]